jgi:uncharacterized protein (DUF952 family)
VSLIYKILPRAEWEQALARGRFEGSQIDLKDGFIHFSSASQAQETARRHFHGQGDLMLVAVPAEALGASLRWEPSRGGDLFPHLYGPLETSVAVEARPLALNAHGAPDLGALATAE